MNETLLNKARLNVVSLNKALINGAVERLRASAGGGGGEVIPPEEPDVPDVPVTYTLNASVENGSVKATVNGVAVTLPYVATAGEVVKLEAVPNSGYVFKRWSDGVTSNPREVVMNSDLTYSAVCEAKTYILSASASNGVVSASVNGNAVSLPYTANEGDVVVVEVTANDGYEFEVWADGSTDNPRSITMTADVTLSATCVVKAVEKEYIQFEDPAVEAICVANWSSDGIGLTMEDAAAVTSIGTTFKGNTVIVSFNELEYFTGVTTLVASAFEGCSNLASLPIEHIVKFNDRALYGCTALTYDNLNLANCTSFGFNVLYGVKVKKLRFEKLTTLPQGSSAAQNYGDKNTLEELVISASVRTIPNYCFEGYINTDIILHEGITTINAQGFHKTGTKGDVNLPNLVTLSNGAYSSSKISRVMNLGAVSTIGKYAFQNCDNLEYVNIPATVTKIDNYAFSDNATPMTMICRAAVPPTLVTTFTSSTITAIYVPDASLEAYKTATNWSSYADRIHPLSEIEGSPYITFADPAVEAICVENWSSDGIGLTKEDAAAVTNIGTLFRDNAEITSFDELNEFTGVTAIKNAFDSCTSLTSIGLKNVQSTNRGTANGCFFETAISKAIMPNIVTLGDWTFRNSAMVEAFLGKNCTYIGTWAFVGTPMTTLVCAATTVPTLNKTNAIPTSCVIYVPDASVDAYKSATNWSSFANNIKGINSLATDNVTFYAEIKDYLS